MVLTRVSLLHPVAKLTPEVVSSHLVTYAIGCDPQRFAGDEKPFRRKAAKSNGRQAGKVREVFDRVSKPPAPSAGTHRQFGLGVRLSV